MEDIEIPSFERYQTTLKFHFEVCIEKQCQELPFALFEMWIKAGYNDLIIKYYSLFLMNNGQNLGVIFGTF